MPKVILSLNPNPGLVLDAQPSTWRNHYCTTCLYPFTSAAPPPHNLASSVRLLWRILTPGSIYQKFTIGTGYNTDKAGWQTPGSKY